MSAPRPRRLPRLSRQYGGTFAGLIIGLIIGLMVAVGVAMTIMKTPLPFVDKLGKQSQPAGELGDPNKTLPGGARERRERLDDDETDPAQARPAPAPPAPPAPPASSPPSAPSGSAKKPAEPLPAAAVVPASPQRSDKDKDRDKDRAAASSTAGSAPAPAAPAGAATAAPSAGGDAFTYYLQAGAFRELQDAEATKGRLALMGVAASIAERKSELGTLYRVRVGPFADVDAMNRARVRLSDNGVDAAVVRVPK